MLTFFHINIGNIKRDEIIDLPIYGIIPYNQVKINKMYNILTLYIYQKKYY
jgi:hypothetical protein